MKPTRIRTHAPQPPPGSPRRGSRGTGLPRWVLAIALVAVLTPWVSADGTGVKTPTERVFQEAEERASTDWMMPRGHLRPFSSSVYCSYERFNNMLWKRHGFLYFIAPTFITQWGTQGGRNDFTTSGQIATMLGWEVLRDSPIGDGAFLLSHLRVDQLTNTTGLEFTRSLGTSFFPSDSVADVDIFKALAWRQSIADDKVIIILGQTLAGEVDGGGRFTADDTVSFLSQPLSTSPVRAMPGAGWGIGVDVNPSDHWTLQTHIQDARGDGNLSDPSEMFRVGEYTAVAGVELKNPFPRCGTGWYKASAYWVPETKPGTPDAQPAGWGLHLLAKIQPAIDAIPDDGKPRTSKNHAFTTKVAAENVRRGVRQIRSESPVLRELEEQGKILIVGALYDVETSLVTGYE